MSNPAVKIATSTASLSAAGLIALAVLEAYSPVPYLDGAKVPTDGFGNTVNVVMGKARGLVHDLRMLLANTESAQNAVRKCLKVDTTQNQFDGLTLFTYNVGNTAFCNSTLVKRLNAKDQEACSEMYKWRFITRNGVKLDCAKVENFKYCGGLVNRRKEEERLCRT